MKVRRGRSRPEKPMGVVEDERRGEGGEKEGWDGWVWW